MVVQGPCLRHCYNFNFIVLAILIFLIIGLVVYIIKLKNNSYKGKGRL